MTLPCDRCDFVSPSVVDDGCAHHARSSAQARATAVDDRVDECRIIISIFWYFLRRERALATGRTARALRRVMGTRPGSRH